MILTEDNVTQLRKDTFMNIKLKDNSQWIEGEEKKKKRRIIYIAAFFLMCAAVIGGSTFYRYYKEKNGSVYPELELYDVPDQGESTVTVRQGYDKVLKVPDLPYTMMIPGTVLVEGDSFCILETNGHHIAIGKIDKNTGTTDFIRNLVLPSLGTSATETLTFQQKRGYINARLVSAQVDTFKRGSEKTIHSISYRILLEENEDIILTGFSTGMDTAILNDEILSIFKSVYQMEGETDQGESSDPGQIDNLTANDGQSIVYEGDGAPMDDDFLEEGTPYSTEKNLNHLYPIDPNIEYMDVEEVTITVDKDMDMGVFIFNYVTEVKLNSITLYDPTGELGYAPDGFDDFFYPEYIWHIDHPMQGDWKVVFSAPCYLGTSQALCYPPEAYTGQESMTQNGDRHNDW